MVSLAGCSAGQVAASQAPTVSPALRISSGCPGNNAEVEAVAAPPGYVYQAWIGCGGIGFARSADGGRHFGPPVTVPASGRVRSAHIGSWDPAVAVAPDGTVYVAFMHQARGYMYPVVAVSQNHGASFARVSALIPPARGNWGDRPFIAVGPGGTVYLTWDYAPSAKPLRLLCAGGGSCSFSAGEFNAVIQRSADRGRSWGPITPIGPGFPAGGGIAAVPVAAPDGRIDVLYLGHPVSGPPSYRLGPGVEYFTSSPDGRHWPGAPAAFWPGQGPVPLPEWWIDVDLAADAAGNLYATWDTQTAHGDVGWLSYSTDGGQHWSRPLRITSDRGAVHIVQVAGAGSGTAYVGWLTNASPLGYAVYLRQFSTRAGWLGPAVQVSRQFGDKTVWPGDTFGLAVLPGRVVVSWGASYGASPSAAIYASIVIDHHAR